jgi:signal transduction histidine kinase
MKRPSPYRLHFILFLIISIIAIAQLTWWVVFQVQEGGRVSSFQRALWNQQMDIARTYFENAELTESEQSSWLNANFPDLRVDPENGNLTVTEKAARRLNDLAHKRVRMFVSEGAFFSLLILSGVWFFYWALRKRIELEYRTANILSAASSGLQKPIAAIRDDIGRLADIIASSQAGEDIIRRISSDVQKIADTCENVSLVRMLSTSKRKLELELIDISSRIELSVNEYRSSHGLSDSKFVSEINKDLSAVTNPHQLSRIVGEMLNIAGDYAGNKGTIDVKLKRENQSAILNIDWRPAENNKNGNTILREIESTSAIIRELAETIGAKVVVQSEDGEKTAFRLEVPLFEE